MHGPEVLGLKKTVRGLGLVTVCEEAGCPNLSECWADGTATFMVLGERCTRACGFCLVDTQKPLAPSDDEPARVAEAVAGMGLAHAVLTMVARDDLPDGGMAHVARCVEAIRDRCPGTRIETLIADGKGDARVADHVVRRSARRAEPQHRDGRPLAASRAALGRICAESVGAGAGQGRRLTTKSGLIVGMGETSDEVDGCLADLASVGVDVVTIGQYLRPTMHHLPVARWVEPDEFAAVEAGRRAAGDRSCRSQPAHPQQLPRPASRRHGVGRRRSAVVVRLSKNGVMSTRTSSTVYSDRLDRARSRMHEAGVDVLLISVGRDLPYLTGYEAMPLERLTMLVVPRDGDATLVVPRLEAPRVVERPGVFTLLPWQETEDPIAVVAGLAGRPGTVAIGDTMWARFLVELLGHWPSTSTQYVRSTEVMNALRMRKDDAEIAALAAAGAAVDRIAAELQNGGIPLVGRTEADISADLGARIIAEGHERVNFAIVAAGENAASPHHHASERVVNEGEILLCDFGGTMNGYCSDITRCVFLGEPPAEIAEAYAVLLEAQRAAVLAGTVGTPCEEVDRVARRIISAAGLRRILHSPHRSWNRHGGTRGSVHGRGQRPAPRARARIQRRAGHLRVRPVGHASRRHRRRHRCRPIAPSTMPITHLVTVAA